MPSTPPDFLYYGAGLFPLTLLLLAATKYDIASARVPNRLVGAGIVWALMMHGLLPNGGGFASSTPGGLGLVAAVQGCLIGFAVFLPAYLIRAMGAGDVKLMAMVGAFLGPDHILPALAGTFLAGGLVALSVAALRGAMRQMFHNLAYMLHLTLIKAPLSGTVVIEPPPQSVAKAPYGVAIALGTVGAIGWLLMPQFSA